MNPTTDDLFSGQKLETRNQSPVDCLGMTFPDDDVLGSERIGHVHISVLFDHDLELPHHFRLHYLA